MIRNRYNQIPLYVFTNTVYSANMLTAANNNTGWWAGRWCWVASSAGDVLLLLHIIGQGPAVLATGAGRVGCIFHLFLMSCLLGDG